MNNTTITPGKIDRRSYYEQQVDYPNRRCEWGAGMKFDPCTEIAEIRVNHKGVDIQVCASCCHGITMGTIR
jgi:hypothetical protein